MQVIGQNNYNPNFTAITRARVFMNGRPYVHRENIKTTARQLQHILTSLANGDSRLIEIKKVFSENVKDFKYYPGSNVAKDSVIRNMPDVDLNKFTPDLADENLFYLFTGKDVEEMAKNGKKIGPERTTSDQFYKKQFNRQGLDFDKYKKDKNPRLRCGEEFELDINYYDKIKLMLTNEHHFTKKNGNILDLIVNVIRDKKGKIVIQNIFFKENLPPKPIEVAPTESTSTISKVIKKVKKGVRKAKNLVPDGQLSLF